MGTCHRHALLFLSRLCIGEVSIGIGIAEADNKIGDANRSIVRDAIIQDRGMLRSLGNVRYAGCICSILNWRRTSAMGRLRAVCSVFRGLACDDDLEDIFDHLFATYRELGKNLDEVLTRAVTRLRGIEDALEGLGDVKVCASTMFRLFGCLVSPHQEKHMGKIKLNDPDLLLSELMSRWPNTIDVFNRHKMLCVGCLISPFHTIVDACAEYGLDEDTFVAELMEAAGL